MNGELKYSMELLSNAISRLEEGIKNAKDELGKDGVIQRFEFTFELLWKTLKLYLENEGIICKSPRDCMQKAFRIDLIEDDEIFLQMLHDRNLSSHLYDKNTSRDLYENIKNKYLPVINNLFKKLDKPI